MFQCGILISLGLIDMFFAMTDLTMLFMCSPLIAVRRCLGDQVSSGDSSTLHAGSRIVGGGGGGIGRTKRFNDRETKGVKNGRGGKKRTDMGKEDR